MKRKEDTEKNLLKCGKLIMGKDLGHMNLDIIVDKNANFYCPNCEQNMPIKYLSESTMIMLTNHGHGLDVDLSIPCWKCKHLVDYRLTTHHSGIIADVRLE